VFGGGEIMRKYVIKQELDNLLWDIIYPRINEIEDRLEKLEELTDADNYEYKTETKLVKKDKN